jgi:hypothetical protein
MTTALSGRDEDDPVAVGHRREPGRVDEALGVLVAAVQQHEQRRAAAAAVPGGEVDRAQPTAQRGPGDPLAGRRTHR